MPGRPAPRSSRGRAVAPIAARSYSTSSGPKQAAQTYDGAERLRLAAVAAARPTIAAARPWPGRARVGRGGRRGRGLGRISAPRVGGCRGARATARATGPVRKPRRPFLRGRVSERCLISQEDLPGFGTLPARAGRLSWLHRAGPSATLDKSSSVVRGSYGPKVCGVNAANGPGPPRTASIRERTSIWGAPRDASTHAERPREHDRLPRRRSSPRFDQVEPALT